MKAIIINSNSIIINIEEEEILINERRSIENIIILVIMWRNIYISMKESSIN